MSENYSFLSKVIHQLTLGAPQNAKTLFALEKKLSPYNSTCRSTPVFITGLARSGTTLLLNILNDTNELSSLSYRNMPFLLAPKTWQKISAPFHQKTKNIQRKHKDLININNESPEGLEEYFWKSFCAKHYIGNDKINPHTPPKAVEDDFKHYIQIIESSKNELRYLSKNNNNILRLSSLNKFFPHGKFILSYRNPQQQSASLYKQHKNFCALQQEDPFILKYMNWLGHYEFGSGHKNFSFVKTGNLSPDEPDYWLKTWIDYYDYVLSLSSSNMIFYSYDALCHSSESELNRLFGLINLDMNNKKSLIESIQQPQNRDVTFSDELTKVAEDIFSKLESLRA